MVRKKSDNLKTMVKKMVKNKTDNLETINDSDYKSIKKLSKILKEENLGEIEYENKEIKIRVSKISKDITGISYDSMEKNLILKDNNNDNSNNQSSNKNQPGSIKSPMVGVAYLSPEPGSPAFVKKGDNVKKGQTILLIEAMKTFNPVEAPFDGVISSINVSDGQPVEFDQLIATIDNK